MGYMGSENHYTTRTVGFLICPLTLGIGMFTFCCRYLVSFILFSACKSLGLWSGPVTTTTLRQTNFYASIVLILLVREILRLIVRPNSIGDGDRTGKGDQKQALVQQLSHITANVFLFPPLFFFCSLYYTDLISALSVLFTYFFYTKKQRIPLVIAGLVSLLFRQTNIFWVSIFLGGLEVSRVLRKGEPGGEFPVQPTFSDVVSRSWQKSCVYDPSVSQAFLEGPESHLLPTKYLLIAVRRLHQSHRIDCCSWNSQFAHHFRLPRSVSLISRRIWRLRSLEWWCRSRYVISSIHKSCHSPF